MKDKLNTPLKKSNDQIMGDFIKNSQYDFA